jgi:hypothetical protein
MARSKARKGPDGDAIRIELATQLPNWPQFERRARRGYWMAGNGGLFSVALIAVADHWIGNVNVSKGGGELANAVFHKAAVSRAKRATLGRAPVRRHRQFCFGRLASP